VGVADSPGDQGRRHMACTALANGQRTHSIGDDPHASPGARLGARDHTPPRPRACRHPAAAARRSGEGRKPKNSTARGSLLARSAISASFSCSGIPNAPLFTG